MRAATKNTFKAVVVCLLATLPVGRAAAASRRALVIGIEKYAPAPGAKVLSGGRTWHDLAGSGNDARDFAQLLADRYEFGRDDVRVLINGEATRAGILSAIDDWLLADAAPGDVRVFYFAGHGSQMDNSKSPERDRKDETLVPSDSAAGAQDIRDKELRARFAKAALAKVKLTVILDSCHSASGARGFASGRRVRMIPPAPGDAADGTESPDPIKAGALVLAASMDTQEAEEDEDEGGASHGAFTLALIRALRTRPADEGIDVVYRKTRALMQGEGRNQEPVLGATKDRKELSLIGEAPKPGKRSVLIGVRGFADVKEVELQGGYGDGLSEGCELVRDVPGGKADTRVKITKVLGLGRSLATIVTKGKKPLESGNLLRVDRWVTAKDQVLPVWVPTVPSVEDVDRLASQARSLDGNGGLRMTADPAEQPPTHVIRWIGDRGWVIESAGAVVPVGKTLTRATVAAVVKGAPKDALFFVSLPAPAALADALAIGPKSTNAGIVREPVRGRAQYQLTGIATAEGVQYAWLLPGAGASAVKGATTLPIRTDWVGGAPADAANKLTEFAVKLARVHGWANLNPATPSDFPYHLVFKVGDKVVGKDTALEDGTEVDAYLHSDSDVPWVDKRSVYAFGIDSQGRSMLIFPREEKVENEFPDSDPPQREVRLFHITISAPFGVDTYYLLTSSDPIPDPFVFEWSGVRRRGTLRGTSPLQSLLSRVGVVTRDKPPASAPATWSIERVSIRSIPDPKKEGRTQ